MKLNVIFIKGRLVIIIFCFSFIILLSYLFINNSFNNDLIIPTMTKPQIDEYLKHDLNGDGTYDLLYISCKNNIYYIEAHIKDKTYFFNTKNTLNTLGNYNEAWPLSIKLIDLNNDNVPEIITQGSFNNIATTHIFTLSNNEFKDVFCSTNNFIGVLESSNNYPVLISSSIDNYPDLEHYTLENNLLKKQYTNTSFSSQSLKIINNIISFIESKNKETNILSNVFSNTILSEDLSLLYSFQGDGYEYVFQNCFLETVDTSSNIYTLNFKKYDKFEDTQLTLNICIDKIDNNFLIISIK